MKEDKLVYWKGRHIDTLNREELLEIINWACRKIQSVESERDRYQKKWEDLVFGSRKTTWRCK